MNSPHEILSISSNPTLEQIESAFQEKSEYWRRLQSNSQRSAEAKAMLEQVMAAYDFLRTQAQSSAGGLEYRELRSFSGQARTAPVDKDSCPHCGHKGNPLDARFCLNVNCRGQLFQLCPSCHRELPWHYQSCPQCGVDIDEEKNRLEVERRRQEIQIIEERKHRLSDMKRKQDLLEDEWLVFNRGSGQNQAIEEFNPEGIHTRTFSIVTIIAELLPFLALSLPFWVLFTPVFLGISLPSTHSGTNMGSLSTLGPPPLFNPITFLSWGLPLSLVVAILTAAYGGSVRSRNAKRLIALQNCEHAIAELEHAMWKKVK